MATLYTYISNNKRETGIIVFFFVILVGFIGYCLDYFYGEGGVFYTGLAFVFAGISSLFSYYNSDKIVLSLSGAKKVDPVAGKDLYNLVENVAIASGLPLPRLYYIEDTAMNAFATGRDPKHSVICVTTGIVQKLEKRELEGVIAHEMSHIGNYDIRLMSIVSVLVGSVTMLSDFFTRGMLYGGKGKRKQDSSDQGAGLLLLFGLFLALLSPIIAQLINLAIGRKREYLADSTAAMITRYPAGLASALKKLALDNEILESANGATAHLFIVSPLMPGKQKQSWVANLFCTHPPIEERIRRLESM